jgi:hypothetical protein
MGERSLFLASSCSRRSHKYVYTGTSHVRDARSYQARDLDFLTLLSAGKGQETVYLRQLVHR